MVKGQFMRNPLKYYMIFLMFFLSFGVYANDKPDRLYILKGAENPVEVKYDDHKKGKVLGVMRDINLGSTDCPCDEVHRGSQEKPKHSPSKLKQLPFEETIKKRLAQPKPRVDKRDIDQRVGFVRMNFEIPLREPSVDVNFLDLSLKEIMLGPDDDAERGH